MAIEFTQEQQEVIRHKDGSLLVSAAAGSGKTAVLVERIITMMTDPYDPVPLDQILVVTFTNQAASQMKEKIEKRILEKMEQEEDSDYLKEQLHLIPLANIQTNHAFSLRIVRDYITRLEDLDPGYRIADETEIKLLRIDVLSEVLEDWYSSCLFDPEDPKSLRFMQFVEKYGGTKQDSKIEDLVLDLYEYMMSNPDPFGWLHRSVEAFDPEKVNEEEVLSSYAALVEDYLYVVMSSLREAILVYQENMDSLSDKDRVKAEKPLFNLQDALAGCNSLQTIQEKADFLSSFVFERQYLKPLGSDGETVTKAVKKAKDAIKKVVSLQLQSRDIDGIREEYGSVYPALRALEELVIDFDKAYRLKKKERNLLEFHDFEHGALKILEDDAIAGALRERYRYIYIDEYQDCNQMQEAIIQKIARKDAAGQDVNVFRVGDVKQSIYRFRQADPSLFLRKYKEFGKLPHTRLLLLNQNFRSQGPVIDAVNDVFESMMIPEVGGLGYTNKERLYQGAEPKETAPVEFTVLEQDGSQDRVETEAEYVAEKVEALLQSGYEKKDIVILMRAVSNVGKDYMNALLRRGIPTYASTSENFYDAKEVVTVLNLLRVIDNPHQDIPLLGVLYSPLVGMTDDDLGRIRLALLDGDFFDALQAFAAGEETTPSATKARKFLDDLSLWREESTLYDIHDFLWKLLTTTGYLGYIKAMPNGALREANIELLLQKSIDFEKGSYSGLYAFLRYIDEMDRSQKTEDEAKLFSEGQDIVRIMTIHQSKGLEFPVVIVAGLGRAFNTMDLNGSILKHDKHGLGVDIIDTDRHYKYPSVSKLILQSTLRKEQMAEEVRLLYVAMTRAMDRLFLVGSRNKEDARTIEKHEDYVLSPQQVGNAKTMLSLLESIVQHKSCVRMVYSVIGREAVVVPNDFTVPYESNPLFDDKNAPISPDEKDETLKKFTWKYPHKVESMIPQVVSVSSLKHQRMEEVREEDTAEVPILSFAALEDTEDIDVSNAVDSDMVAAEAALDKVVAEENNKASSQSVNIGAKRGTAFHTVMAFCDLMALKENPKQEISRLVEEGLLSEEERSLIPGYWIRNVINSDLFQELTQALRSGRKVYREESFILKVPFKKIKDFMPEALQEADSEDSVLVQGIIDLFYEKDGTFVLADYKTDSVLDEARVAGYKVQLEMYKNALEKASSKKVSQMLLFDVRRGKEIIC